jgi:hypothetical protein
VIRKKGTNYQKTKRKDKDGYENKAIYIYRIFSFLMIFYIVNIKDGNVDIRLGIYPIFVEVAE